MTNPGLQWLMDQIQADHDAAKATADIAQPPWHVSDDRREWEWAVSASAPVKDGATRPDESLWKVEGQIFGTRQIAEHIARHDPARVLATVTALREVLDRHRPRYSGQHDHIYCFVCKSGDWFEPWPCPTTKATASIYRHADGYTEHWGQP